ncbi:pyroglutamyl-peptidase I [Nicoliella lavandulae]|uniref:Pyroglutamyl-peptidase I n=1 Tax=Nicoliella lavandulae TaxID=3082954 RepID=A0ABU8SMU2_9LACO
MKILITGFSPFDNYDVNPSLEVLNALPDRISDFDIIKVPVPTSFKQSSNKIVEAIKKYQPNAVLSIGQAGGRDAITPELVAINMDDARIADNDGFAPESESIHKDGENAYFSSLPVKQIAQRINNMGIKSRVSTTAGTFVCNHIMYESLYYISKKNLNVIAGFIHVPSNPAQVADDHGKSMNLSDEVAGIREAVKTISKYLSTKKGMLN